MSKMITSLSLPDYVFHGTVISAVDSIKDMPINPKYMKDNRDFGAGFYTTIDFKQACDWAMHHFMELFQTKPIDLSLREYAHSSGKLPTVVVLQIDPDVHNINSTALVFSGDTMHWAKFILKHRLYSKYRECACPTHNPHPDIIIGQMADNNTSLVVKAFESEGLSVDSDEHVHQFKNYIRLKDGKRVMNGLDLGNQITFCNVNFNEYLSYFAHYTLDIDLFERSDILKDYTVTKDASSYFTSEGVRFYDIQY